MDGIQDAPVPVEDLRHPNLLAALAYWNEIRGDRPMPARRQLDPERMKRYLRNVMLVEVRRDPLDFRFRVIGTGIVENYGKDITWRSVRDIVPEDLSRAVWGHYAECLERRGPVLHRVRYLDARKHKTYHRLTLPLSSDGAEIDRILSVVEEDRNAGA